MLQAVVGDHGSESPVEERKTRCVAMDKVRALCARIAVDADLVGGRRVRGETTCAATEFKDEGTGQRVFQDVMHAGLLQRSIFWPGGVFVTALALLLLVV